MEKKGYIGKIANAGAQKVEAPCLIKKPSKGKVRTAKEDLRNGK